MRLRRRAFIGALGAAAVAPKVFAGTGCAIPDGMTRTPMPAAVELKFDNESRHRPVSPGGLARALLRRIDARTRDLGLLRVGGESNMPGFSYGSGYFDAKVFALVQHWPSCREQNGRWLLYDPLLVGEVVEQFVAQLRSVNPSVTGFLDVPQGLSYAGNHANRRIALRCVVVYELQEDSYALRLDVLTDGKLPAA